MTSIRELPAEVRSYLRSGVTVTSVTQCVEELLLNSIDAGASCIAVRVDLDLFKIQVVDNGTGVSHNQLKLLGERYATSKCHSVADLSNLTYFGYRGEALASIKESCSVLEITTKTKQSSKTYSKLFQDGSSLEVIESTVPRPSVGMTVTVHDLFSKFPVRRRSTNVNLELERIRQRVEGLALLKPAVSISLRNDSTGLILLQTHKSSNSLLTFQYLFGAAKASTLSEVNGSKNYFIVEGFLGKEGHSKKELQFVYVNGRLVLKTRIHKVVNKMLTNSAIFKRKYEKSPVVVNKSVFVKSPGRQVERYPVFVLNIKCPWTKYDITFDPSKTLIEFKDWDSVLELIKEIIDTFLKKEDLFNEEMTINSNKDTLTVESIAENCDEELAHRTISASKIKDTLFSKPVKRKSGDSDLFKTPVSISIEQWKTENKTRKVTINESSSLENCANNGLNRTILSECTGEDNSVSSGCSDLEQRTFDEDKETFEDNKPTSKSGKSVLEAAKTEGGNKDDVKCINEKGDSIACKEIIALKRSHNKVTDSMSNLKKTDHSTDEFKKTQNDIKEIVPQTNVVTKTPVVVSSKSSLSEFKRIVGRSVSNMNKPASIDEKLQTNFNLQSEATIDDITNSRQKFSSQSEKFTSSLQKFRKSAPFCGPPKYKVINTLWNGKDNTDPDRGFPLKRNETERLGKSGVSLVDCRTDTFASTRMLNETNKYCSSTLDNYDNKSQCMNIQNLPIKCRDYTHVVPTNEHIATNDICCQDSSSNSLNFQRKRKYGSCERDIIAHKLSRLSRQKIATISVTSSTGFKRSPVDAEFSCGDNAVVTVIKTTASSTQNSVEPSCTQTSASASFEHLPSICLTDTSMFDRIPCMDSVGVNVFPMSTEQFSINRDNLNTTCKTILLPSFERESEDMHEKQPNYTCHEVENGHGNDNYGKGITYNAEILQGIEGSNFLQSDRFIAENINNVPIEITSKSCEQSSTCLPFEYGNNPSSELSIPESDAGKCAITAEKADTGLSNYKKLTLVNDAESEQFVFSTQEFSPLVNASQSGLSEKMTAITISQGFEVKNETQSSHLVTSPYSEGFSPCMSLSSKSNGNSPDLPDSQGFVCNIEESYMQNGMTDNQTEEQTVDAQIIDDHSKAKLASDEIVIMKEKSKRDSVIDNIDSSEIDIINQSSSPFGTDSEDVFSNKTVSVSQMLLTAPLPENCIASTDVLPDSSKDVRFCGIFTQGLPEDTYEGLEKVQGLNQTDCYENKDSSENHEHSEAEIEQTTSKNKTCSEKATVDSADSQFSTIEDSFTDTLLQATSGNSEVFSSWDESYEIDILKSSGNLNVKSIGCDKKYLENKQINDFSKLTDNEISYTDTKEVCNGTKSNAEINEVVNFVNKSAMSNILMNAPGNIGSTNVNPKLADINYLPKATTKTCETASATIQSQEDACKDCERMQFRPGLELEKQECHPGTKSATEQRKWIKMKDPQTGKTILVHSLLGTTVTESQWKVHHSADSSQENIENDVSTAVNISKDKNTVETLTPKTSETLNSLMMDHFTTDSNEADDDDDNEEDALVKWRDSSSLSDTVSDQGPSAVEDLFVEWDNPVFEPVDKDVMNTEIGSLPKSTVKAYRALHSCKFTKDMLNTVKVIGQVDKKFIACLMDTDPSSKDARKDMLAVIDQHAAHERIRLELLTEEAYVDSNVDSRVLAVYNVDPPKHLQLKVDEVRVMESYREEFNRIGVKFHCDPQARNTVVVESVPACIMEKDVNYVKSTREAVAWNIVQALLKEHVDLLICTGGGGKRFPTVLHKALCAQACHGAIKFGDNLTQRECEALIRDLSRCDLPFQCAHGRPSVMPILQLEQLRTKLPQQKQRKPQLYKLARVMQRDETPKQ